MAKKVKDEEATQPETSDGSIAANDAWTGLLAVSFLALAIGSGFLAYDYWKYSDGDLPKIPLKAQAPPNPIAPKSDVKDEKDKKKDGTSLRQPATTSFALATMHVSESERQARDGRNTARGQD
jgi:hypothetical protein